MKASISKNTMKMCSRYVNCNTTTHESFIDGRKEISWKKTSEVFALIYFISSLITYLNEQISDLKIFKS
ncbi:MAG: hypothetical protein H6622_06155 [Halobacteriovoraceae bacterium]|nr:hypothetical protein [Halobacteriovoraceae bacterium]